MKLKIHTIETRKSGKDQTALYTSVAEFIPTEPGEKGRVEPLCQHEHADRKAAHFCAEANERGNRIPTPTPTVKAP